LLFVAVFDKADVDKDINTQEGEERPEPQPRALHRTQSIFLKNLPALITRQEIEEVDEVFVVCQFFVVTVHGDLFAEVELAVFLAQLDELFI